MSLEEQSAGFQVLMSSLRSIYDAGEMQDAVRSLENIQVRDLMKFLGCV